MNSTTGSMVAKDNLGQPAFGMIQQSGMEGPDVWYHALMLSWACFQIVRDILSPAPGDISVEYQGELVVDMLKHRDHYKELKNAFLMQRGYKHDPRNIMPIHPDEFLQVIVSNHIRAGLHFGYLGRFARVAA